MDLPVSILSASMATGAVAEPATVVVTPVGSQASATGPADWFTGRVRIDAPFQTCPPARNGGATVTFEPGACTAWHTHPLGQTLIVVAGAGWVQAWGEPAHAIGPGDTVWIPPGVKHWHGARADVAMSHIAIAESVDGSPVTWMEHVAEMQYPRH
ncbi:MAG TPA: cupin domain-containing protein [Xanthomonadaceae bacterium]|nr:cupin domain-containing protein [Xanthomonadaceae bacterium]